MRWMNEALRNLLLKLGENSMDEHEVRLEAIRVARDTLGKEASLQDTIDLAWKLSKFIEEGWTFKEIEAEFAENE